MMEDRHAYLIIAHNDFESLCHLIQAIDDVRNDIYIHIDKKAKHVDLNKIRSSAMESEILFTPRIDVRWGHHSQVRCELLLLKEATLRKHYHYYHLLSGFDFPLKSQNEIHDCLKSMSQEFIEYHYQGDEDDDFMYKIMYYHPFLKWIGRGGHKGNSVKERFLRGLSAFEWKLLVMQKNRSIDRTKRYKGIQFAKGANWFSITDDFARYVVSKSQWIMRMCWLMNGPDEIFLPTVAINSVFKDRVCNNCLRKIDWTRGRPYEFVYTDLDELMESDCFFARKISYTRQPELVRALMEHIGIVNVR